VAKVSGVKQGRIARLASCAAGPRHLLLAAVPALLFVQWPGGAAQADAEGLKPLPRTALLRTSRVKAGPEAERDAAFDDVVHTGLEKLQVVDVVVRPALDLEAIQLSLDCVGETPECLLGVAKHTNAEVLIAPSIQRAGQELVLSILYFDARGATELRRASRRQPGVVLQPDTLDGVPDMLRELFRLAPEEAAAPAEVLQPPQPEVALDDAFPEPIEAEHGDAVSAGPFLLAGGGLLTLGAGIAVGTLLVKETEDEYAAIRVTSEARAQEAHDKREEGETQALLASILIGTGAAALLAGGVWLAAELDDNGESQGSASLHPIVGPDRAGLLLAGSFGGGL
jgi:hypothetical protein